VLVNGARQAGKSTLTRLAVDNRPGTVVRLLDDAATLRAARDDPQDSSSTTGSWSSTRSSSRLILALRSLPDALPGRMEVIELWPFSQGEMHGGRDLFVDAAFRHGAAIEHSPRMRKRDYLELAVVGGFPEAVRRTPRRRGAFFFSSYLSTLIERDVLEVSSIELAFVDTGIACHLIGQDAARLDEPDGAAGPVLENFVVMELARQLTWAEERARLFHYRTKDKLEVDAVIETPDGRVIAVEVKAGATVRTEDLAGLRNLDRRARGRHPQLWPASKAAPTLAGTATLPSPPSPRPSAP
jgi:hypothetical protein